MSEIIGFHTFQRNWEGPIALEFSFYSEHSRVARYRCPLETRMFDLYVPLFMLTELVPGPPPDSLVAVIGKGPGPLRTVGFSSAPTSVTVQSDVCEYEFAESKANSERYNFVVEGECYSLYVPKEIFAEHERPHRLYLRIALPASSESSV